jgi:hypothetical protein
VPLLVLPTESSWLRLKLLAAWPPVMVSVPLPSLEEL